MRNLNRIAQIVLVATVASLFFGPGTAAADGDLKWSQSVADRFLGPYVMLLPTAPYGKLVLVVAPNDGIFPTKLPAQADAETVTFDLVVSADGTVERATGTSKPPIDKTKLSTYHSIRRTLQTWRFRPFTDLDVSHPVTIRDVPVVVAGAPAQVGHKIRYPNSATANDIRVRLENRSGGDRGGGGTTARFEVGSDGVLTYVGSGFVAITGEHRAQLDPTAVRALISLLTSMDPTQAATKSARRMFHAYDYDAITISSGNREIFFGGQTRVENLPKPNELDVMARAIRDTIDTDRWTKGNAATIPSLRAEGWNFRSESSPNADFVYGAAVARNEQLVQELIALGAPVGASLKRAAEICDKNAVLLMQKHSRKLERAVLTSAMVSMARCNAFDAVKALIAAGANPKGVDERGTTLLIFATSSGDARFVKYALDQGVEVDAKMLGGRMAIHAVRNEETLQLLLDAGADINARDDSGTTPLMSHRNNEEMLPLMIKLGADVNAADNSGYTALSYPYPCPSYRASRILKDAGAKRSDLCPWSD